MGVRKKGRRKLICGGKLYFWQVSPDDDSPYLILTVLSEDKRLILACPLGQKTPYAVSKGRLFQNAQTNGFWNRYRLPFEIPDKITPQFVSELIVWAAAGSDAVKIEWNGTDITV